MTIFTSTRGKKEHDPRYTPGVSDSDDWMTDDEWWWAYGPGKRAPENPILVKFREQWLEGEPYTPGSEQGFWWYGDWDGTPEQIEHARKVLTRLAALS